MAFYQRGGLLETAKKYFLNTPCRLFHADPRESASTIGYGTKPLNKELDVGKLKSGLRA